MTKRAKDEDEAANENKTVTHPDTPAQDPKGKAKAEDKKGPPRIPPDPRVTANLRIPVATAVAPTTLPEPAINVRMKRRMTNLKQHINKQISIFRLMRPL